MDNSAHVLNVLGVDIDFKTGANLERARQAAQLIEDRFEAQKKRTSGGQCTEEVLLTFLALGLADDLLQAKSKLEELSARMASALEKIESVE
ncbi:MAG: cell division protein ZapA [Desulfovibrio sp.]|nr:cell division protein ZapA [Desulfovibrio sp.]